MASHDQSYKAGETKGVAQEKTEQMMGKGREAAEAVKDKAQGAKDKAVGSAQAGKGQAIESKDQTGSFLSEKAGAAQKMALGATEATKKKGSEMVQTARETAQVGQEKTSGILQQTGEQVISMAQGAADTVKRTLGKADTNKDGAANKGTTNKD